MEGFARFEQRARQRRIEKRLEAARAAIAGRKFAEAREALAEVRELDPLHPEIARLDASLQQPPRRRAAAPWAAPRLAASAAFAVMMLAASWVGHTGLLQSYPMVATAALAPSTTPTLPSTEITLDLPIEDLTEPLLDLADAIQPAAVPAMIASAAGEPPAREAPRPPEPLVIPNVAATTGVVDAPGTPAPVAVPAPPPAPAASPAPAANIVPAPPVVDDAELVRGTLRRYQTAYERLDARMARAVWPAVDQAALARAFDGLESQRLQFDACDVQLRGSGSANATCRGSARFVPKVGSREPRVESRVWNFTLRKYDSGWEIETVRAER